MRKRIRVESMLLHLRRSEGAHLHKLEPNAKKMV